MHRVLLPIALFVTASAAAPARADLDAYFRKPEPSYRWEKRGEQTVDGCKVYDLHLVSQVWQGITWEHRLQVVRPEKLDYPGFCTIYNTGGSGSSGNTQMALRMAKESGATFAILYNVPKQPLYDGKVEDELVVYTWLKYLETGDTSWPLHFPMAKAVLKSMDAIQAFGKEAGFQPITGFTVAGASKRGWTAWLVGASRDSRVKAIVPMVIDVLNVRAQAKYQVETYGKPSEQVDDYTKAGILEKLETPAGKKLMELEDPYSYRNRLTLPKLLILGTNDRYWTQDALNLYWDGLKGPKWVLYVPNSGHGLEDRERVYATWSAFIRMIAGGGRWPRMEWSYRDNEGGKDLRLRSDIPPAEGRLFAVTSRTKDFRDSHWSFQPMRKEGGALRGWRATPSEGYAAVFGEAVYTIDGRTFTLSTQIRILGGEKKRDEFD
jgi:PhoPQ-activated pathogenicity-related protein